MNHTYFKITY